jgi:hypothetical protein
MPLELPRLDDRSYRDLVQEAMTLIPRYAPTWTNHNLSDPGITLVELLAYVTESLLYRVDRVSAQNKVRFLRLLRGHDWHPSREVEHDRLVEIDDALRESVSALWTPQRAVRPSDFERLALLATSEAPAEARVVRVRAILHRKPASAGKLSSAEWPGHVSVVVLGPRGLDQDQQAAFLRNLKLPLQERALLTTRVHVVAPTWLYISLGIVVRAHAGLPFAKVQKEIVAALEDYVSAYPGEGAFAEGWPFGRNLYLSEVESVIASVRGVDRVVQLYVSRLTLGSHDTAYEGSRVGIQVGIFAKVGVDTCLGGPANLGIDRLVRGDDGKLAAIELDEHELPRIMVHSEDIRSEDSLGNGTGWMSAVPLH